MARIVLTTNGSLGDLHPFLAAGVELRTRGHAVRFAVMEPFHARMRAAGLATDPRPNDLPGHGRAGDRTISGAVRAVSTRRLALIANGQRHGLIRPSWVS